MAKLLLAALCLLGAGVLSAQDENYLEATTQPATGNVQQGATQRQCLSFAIMRLSNFGDTFQTVTVRNNGTAQAADFNQLQIWFDANDSDTFEPAGPDQLVASAASSAFPVTFPAFNHGIAAWSVFNYFISVDVAATATVGATFCWR